MAHSLTVKMVMHMVIRRSGRSIRSGGIGSRKCYERHYAEPGDAAASYALLRRSGYFEPTSKVSRAKLQNLINEERRAGNIGPALTVDRLIMPGLTELAD